MQPGSGAEFKEQGHDDEEGEQGGDDGADAEPQALGHGGGGLLGFDKEEGGQGEHRQGGQYFFHTITGESYAGRGQVMPLGYVSGSIFQNRVVYLGKRGGW